MPRNIILLFVLSILLAMPISVYAQSSVTFEKLDIQLWPDYDQASVLIIYDFVVSSDVTVPAQISLQLPAGSQLLAVAKDENGRLVNIQHQLPERKGDYDVLSLSVIDHSLHHVEYYIPYKREGNTRSFTFNWPGNYAIKAASVRFQQPIDATDVKTEPAFSSIGKQPDGFVYYGKDLGALSAGQVISVNVSYQKTTDTLSASQLDVQSTLPLDQNVPGQSTFISYLPWALGGLGVALLVVAGGFYWASGRAGRAVSRPRKRHTAVSEEPREDDEQVHCAQCGKRAQPGDRFCRACGARIRRSEA